MIERSIVEAALALRAAGEAFVIATVVAVQGSAYRRPGARMLVARDRWVAGAVSGGCLEGDIVAKGWWRTEPGVPVVITYDSLVDPDADEAELREGLGLGCNGIVDVMIERAGGGQGVAGADPIALAAACLQDQQRAALVTVFRSDVAALPVGARVAVREGAVIGATPGGEALGAPVLAWATAAIASGESRVETLAIGGGTVEILVEAIVPPPRLFLLGAGHDAVPVAELGRALGWEVVVCAASASAQTKVRFPRADALAFGAPAAFVAQIDACDRAAVVVMNHHYERDRDCLAALLPSRARYIGVLGPQRRTARALADLGLAPGDFGTRLHAPVGLELAAETPAEIALAIVAEIQAALARAPATMLRERVGAIHDVLAPLRRVP